VGVLQWISIPKIRDSLTRYHTTESFGQSLGAFAFSATSDAPAAQWPDDPSSRANLLGLGGKRCRVLGWVRPLRQKHLPDPIAVTELVGLNDQHLANANAADCLVFNRIGLFDYRIGAFNNGIRRFVNGRRLGVKHCLDGSGILGCACLFGLLKRLALLSAALAFLLPAFPFFLAISVSLPMMIPLDEVWPKSGAFRPASCEAGPVDAGFGEGTLVNWIFALPIALVIVLLLVHALAGGEAAWFLDQLVIAGVLAFGIVRAFFA
jgi:hypothetical protein